MQTARRSRSISELLKKIFKIPMSYIGLVLLFIFLSVGMPVFFETNQVPKQLLDDPNLSSKINREEFKFRDELVSLFDSISESNNNLVDSISLISVEKKGLLTFLTLKSIESLSKEKNVVIPIEQAKGFLENLRLGNLTTNKAISINVTFSIDKEKLKNIISTQEQTASLKDIIKFG